MPLRQIKHPSGNRSWTEIDLTALAHNVIQFKKFAGENVIVMPMVKADGYGHGAVEVSKKAIEVGASRLGVATCLEAEVLRMAGIKVPIQIAGTLVEDEVKTAVKLGLILSLHDLELARLVNDESEKAGLITKVHLKIDSGMGRLGILPEDAVDAAKEISSYSSLELEGAFMHFSDAFDSEFSKFQIKVFDNLFNEIEGAGIKIPIKHAVATDAALLYKGSHYNMIRPGIGIYGIYNSESLYPIVDLKRVLSWRAVIIQVKEYPEGYFLGYGRTFQTKRRSKIAIIPVGYADGYRRGLSNKSNVIVNGSLAPVVGRVSMDYMMADVTDIEDANAGSVATLIGSDGDEIISAEDLASLLPECIAYEIVSTIGSRIGRRYIEG
jgi:alanine racemase